MKIFCSSEKCPNPARTSGLCPMHYAQSKYDRSPRLEETEGFEQCSVSHCDLPANSRVDNALCNPHYQKKYRGIDPETYVIPDNHPARTAPICRYPGCQKSSHVKEMCNYHYNRILKGRIVDPEGKIEANQPCSFPACKNAAAQKGLCQSHYEQNRLKGVMAPLRDFGIYQDGSKKCAVSSCKAHAVSKNLCSSHFRQSDKYKLPVEKLEELWSKPWCSTPGCTNTTRLHIDHDHNTGVVRGLLCSGCNTSLGMLKEDIARIEGLAEYKRLHS